VVIGLVSSEILEPVANSEVSLVLMMGCLFIRSKPMMYPLEFFFLASSSDFSRFLRKSIVFDSSRVLSLNLFLQVAKKVLMTVGSGQAFDSRIGRIFK